MRSFRISLIIADLGPLKKLRGVYKDSLTRVYNFVMGLNDESADSVEYLENKLAHAKECFNDFMAI